MSLTYEYPRFYEFQNGAFGAGEPMDALVTALAVNNAHFSMDWWGGPRVGFYWGESSDALTPIDTIGEAEELIFVGSFGRFFSVVAGAVDKLRFRVRCAFSSSAAGASEGVALHVALVPDVLGSHPLAYDSTRANVVRFADAIDPATSPIPWYDATAATPPETFEVPFADLPVGLIDQSTRESLTATRRSLVKCYAYNVLVYGTRLAGASASTVPRLHGLVVTEIPEL